ncbi:MAG: hypothetical protein KDD67_02720 [Ignavibacteriae bacterium]|nr:hypothetical protein [Ignavibacteriota bacterium]MCB9216954.1 hypothetical protein [Ignavibacteria bacterium]
MVLTRKQLAPYKPLLVLMLFFSAGFVFTACEDDPILQPSDSTSKDGGSYGRIDIAPDNSGRADKRVPAIRSNPATNPELF